MIYLFHATLRSVQLAPMENLDNASGLGFLPFLVYQGLGDLPVVSRTRLLTEQRAVMRDMEMCKFFTLEDWSTTFYGESWPQLRIDPGVSWPEMEEEADQEGEGNKSETKPKSCCQGYSCIYLW